MEEEALVVYFISASMEGARSGHGYRMMLAGWADITDLHQTRGVLNELPPILESRNTTTWRQEGKCTVLYYWKYSKLLSCVRLTLHVSPFS